MRNVQFRSLAVLVGLFAICKAASPLALHEEPFNSSQIRHRGATGQYRFPDSADHPLVSTLEPWAANFTGPATEARDFYTFHNVMLNNDSLLFYHIGDKLTPLPEQPPAALRLSRYEIQLDLRVDLVTQENRSHFPQHCREWVTKPALLFSGSPWDDNINEFFTTAFMPWWQTAVMTGLLDPERAQRLLQLDRQGLSAELHDPESSAPFVLITGRPVFYAARWGYLAELVTRDQWALEATNRVCFSKLVVSEDAVLRFLYERVVEMRDPAYVAYRAAWFGRFQRHLFALEKLHATVHEQNWPLPSAAPEPRQPRVTFISRPARFRRAVLNEQEIVDALLQAWDVNVTVTTFAMPLRDAITLMQETDVLIGMHGAGLTNAFWMRPGSVLLQLVPYGWEVHHGQLIRSSLSQDIPLAVGGHYLQWVSPYAHNAHFLEGDFAWSLANWKPHWGVKPGGYQAHPTPELKLPDGPDSPNFWMYQNTWVDVTSLRPTLEQALGLVGAQKAAEAGRGGSQAQSGGSGGGVRGGSGESGSRRARRV